MSRRRLNRCVAFLVLTAVTAAASPVGEAAAPATSQRVYENNFSGDVVGPEWSKRDKDLTPREKRPFLGGFGGESVTLDLRDLPPHRFVRLAFDLFVINPADGSSPIWGPDVWDLTVDGGPTLLHTTFTNCGFFRDNNEQAFPDEFPCQPHPGFTGAFEKQMLGYVVSWGGPERTFVTDSVYRLEFTFPHDAPAVSLIFTSFSPEEKSGEAWGLTNVSVDVLPDGERLDRDELEQLWRELGGNDPVAALKAKWKFVAAPDDARPFLASKLRTDYIEKDKVAGLIADFESADTAVRDAASAKLIAMGDRIIPALLKHLRAAELPETAARIAAAVAALTDVTTHGPDPLRRARAFHAMEAIDRTPNPARRNALTLPPLKPER